MTSTEPPRRPEVVARTLFSANAEGKWTWETKSLDNEVIASSQEVHDSLRESLDNFFSANNIQRDEAFTWPRNFGPLMRLANDQYQINKFI